MKTLGKILLGLVLTLLASTVCRPRSAFHQAKLVEEGGYDRKNAFEPEDLSEFKALAMPSPKRLRLALPTNTLIQ